MLTLTLALPLMTDEQVSNAEHSAWMKLQNHDTEAQKQHDKLEEEWLAIREEYYRRLNLRQINLVAP